MDGCADRPELGGHKSRESCKWVIETMSGSRGKLGRPSGCYWNALAIAMGTAPALLLAGCGSSATPHPAPASAGQIHAFVAEAKHGFAGPLTLTYDVTVRYGQRVTRRILVSAEQRSADVFSYRMKPSLELSGPGGPPASYSYEVFSMPGGKRGPSAGLYSCRKPLPSSHWSCEGPYTQIGMGGMFMLVGPYPPQALLLGLENAVAIYTDVPPMGPVPHAPAFLVTRQVSGQTLRCLDFGGVAHPVGSVCLRHSGLIVSYHLAGNVTSGVWDTAALSSYSPHVASNAVALPTKPRSFQEG